LRGLADPPAPSASLRFLWWGLLAWLVVRFALLGYEVSSRPLYPWDAWIEWATKARVYFQFGRIEPFLPSDAWLASDGKSWFDASPRSPVTLPLLQTWACIALGRWDDVLMNWPWWQLALALVFLVYGGLCREGLDRTGALIGAYFAASLPLANVHVALAGYADLPLAAFYAAAVLSFMQWIRTRAPRDVILALLLAVACPLVKATGAICALTLVPGLAVALWPRRGPRIVAGALALALFGVAVLAQTFPVVAGRSLHLDFAPVWSTLHENLFLFANWHLLWYGLIGITLLAWRHMAASALAPLTAIVAAALCMVLLLFLFPTLRGWLIDPPTFERATLGIAPVLVVFVVLSFRAFAETWTSRHTTPPVPAAPSEPDVPTQPDASVESAPAAQAV
jgi:hypothetical protein